jgi:hypothetical protein
VGQDAAPVQDAGAVDDAAGPQDSGAAADASAVDASSSDSGATGITVTIGTTVTTFAYNPSVTNQNGLLVIHSDDSGTSTHWTMQIVIVGSSTGASQCSPYLQPSYPYITYTHYTSGVADDVYSSKQMGAACVIDATSNPASPGQHAQGTFSGDLMQAPDAGGGSAVLANGSYDIVM